MEVLVVEDDSVLAAQAASLISTWLRDSSGSTNLGLAGGRTPRGTYERLREDDVPWSRVDVWMGDERWVPPDHSENNGFMARRALLDHVPARFHSVPWREGLSPWASAASYEAVLKDVLADESGRIQPDVIILGIGADAHVCSLFPGTDALNESDRLYTANWVPQQDTWRLTATFPLLHAARHLLFLVTGTSKAEAVAEILQGDSPEVPARKACMGASGHITWLLDREAAALLS